MIFYLVETELAQNQGVSLKMEGLKKREKIQENSGGRFCRAAQFQIPVRQVG